MVSETGFWRWIWRFNALAIAAVVMLGGVLGLAALYLLIQDLTSERRVGGLVNVDPIYEASTKIELSGFSPLGKTGLFWSAINRETTSDLLASLKRASATADYVIYNPTNGESRRLLGLDDSLILEARLLHRPDDPQGRGRAVAMLVRYVDADSNGDNRLNAQDRQKLAFAKPNGVDLTPLIELDRSLGTYALSDRRVVVMIQTEAGAQAMHVDLQTLSINRTSEIMAEAP